MFFRLFILFTLVPFIELALLIKIGTIIGPMDTILLIIVTGVLGAMMVRAAGIQCLLKIRHDLQMGTFPAEELFNGLLILISGVLLITPGLITDALGLLLLFPPSREVVKVYLKKYVKRRIDLGQINADIDIKM